ncbi:hypothetical protein, partial [Muricoccus vinaceus]
HHVKAKCPLDFQKTDSVLKERVPPVKSNQQPPRNFAKQDHRVPDAPKSGSAARRHFGSQAKQRHQGATHLSGKNNHPGPVCPI